MEERTGGSPGKSDWLVTPLRQPVEVTPRPEASELVLSNGLISRTFRTAPNFATTDFTNLVTGATVIRGVKPEAIVTLDGQPFQIGGLKGQPDYAYLDPAWLKDMAGDPKAFEFTGFTTDRPKAPYPWKPKRGAPDVPWPPKGLTLRATFQPPASAAKYKGLTVTVHMENPILMHVRQSDSASIRRAVDQCAEVGFEMVIVTFWSGFNIESEDPAYIARMKADFDYAHGKGIEIGGYTLMCASRDVGPENNCISPQSGKPGSKFGQSACLASEWADGKSVDCMVHVNAQIKERALAMVYNPADSEVAATLDLPLYYAGLTDRATIREQDGEPREYKLDRGYHVSVPVKLGPKSITWLIVKE